MNQDSALTRQDPSATGPGAPVTPPQSPGSLPPIIDVVAARPTPILVTLTVNAEARDLLVPPHKTLLEVLREDLGLTGTKHGCELGECGTCTVLVDGEPVLSCLALPVEVQGRQIATVEGMATGSRLHPLQQAFAELGAAQCGYCTPGLLLTSQALLAGASVPTRQQIREALAGNLCRCTGYTKILDAVELAALRMAREGDVTAAEKSA